MIKRPTPHDYQVRAIQNARQLALDGIRRFIIVAPTGGGKTTVAAEIIDGAVAKERRVLFIANREELVTQASARLALYGIHHGIIKAGWRPLPGMRVQVASIQTLIKRTLPPADLVIIDEAHISASKSFEDVIAQLPDATVIGLTATPWRLDGKGLGHIYSGMVLVCQPRELIYRERPMLLEPRVFAPSVPKLKGIAIRGGDYDQEQIQALMATKASVDEIIANWQRRAAHLQTVVFATGIEHSRMIQAAFRAIGVDAAHLDAKTPAAERTRIINGLASGAIQVVTNCGILVAGWDCPAMACAILARPTQSLTLYLQMVGRVLRVAPGKEEAIVLDHAGCTEMHGYATEDREWDLEGRKKKPGAAPVKTCPDCYCSMPSNCRECPECGHEFKAPERDPKEDEPLDPRELQEITPTMLRERAARLYARVREAGGDLFIRGKEVLYRGPEGVWNPGHAQLRLFFAKILPPANVVEALTGHDRWLNEFLVPGREHTMAEKQALYNALVKRCLDYGFKTGFVYHKFKLVTGKEPRGLLAACPHAEAFALKKQAEKEAQTA